MCVFFFFKKKNSTHVHINLSCFGCACDQRLFNTCSKSSLIDFVVREEMAELFCSHMQ